jgi:hypothetical protein
MRFARWANFSVLWVSSELLDAGVTVQISCERKKNSYENILIILAISIRHAMSNLLKHVLGHWGMTEVVVLILNLEMEYV